VIEMRVILVDNYDSFTWNLVHLMGAVGCEAEVVRNDRITVAEAMAKRPEAIVLSPGPCTPREAGICCALIEAAKDSVPIFGVCLGLQAIGQALGGEVVRAPVPRHGKVSTIHHEGGGLFRGLNGPFQATRYHSLVVDRASCPEELEITAESDDGLVMAISHRRLPLHGVQFHPESILSEHGTHIAGRFLELAAAWNARPRR
jgi:anthranilate synthase component II